MCVHVCACVYTLNCHPPLSLAQSLLAMLGWWAIDSWGSSCPCLPSAQMTGTTQVPWLAQKALSSLSHGQPHVHECRCLWCPAEGVRFPPATPPHPPQELELQVCKLLDTRPGNCPLLLCKSNAYWEWWCMP